MLFSNFDPYNNDEDDNKEKEDCFICYEKGTNRIEMEDQEYYFKKCKCLGIVHKDCLDRWYDKSHKCPVCREFIIKKSSDSLFIVIPYNITYYLVYQYGIKHIAKITTIIIFMYCLLELYYTIINTIFTANIGYYEIEDYYHHQYQYVK